MSMAPAGVPYCAPEATAQRYCSIWRALNCPLPPVVAPPKPGSSTGRTVILLVENGRSLASAAVAPRTHAAAARTATPTVVGRVRMAPPPTHPWERRCSRVDGHAFAAMVHLVQHSGTGHATSGCVRAGARLPNQDGDEACCCGPSPGSSRTTGAL